MFRTKPCHHKALSTDEGKVTNYTWVHLLRQLMKSTIHYNTFKILEAVFFHPIFPNRPQELCSQSKEEGILMQDVRDLTATDVIRGCAQVVSVQSIEDSWSPEPLSMVIKDGKYLELDLLALSRFPKLFPGGATALVFSKVQGVSMKPGVFVHEIKRNIDVEKDEIRCEGADTEFDEFRLREHTWALLKVLETQLQAKCLHLLILYKLSYPDETPYVAYVVKCVARDYTTPQRVRHKRNNSTNWKSPLSTWMQSTSMLKTQKIVQFVSSLRAFVVNPSSGAIIHPKHYSQCEGVPLIQRSLSQMVGPSVDQSKQESDKSEIPAKKKELRGGLRKRGLLPLLRREESDYIKTMELHGNGFPWRHSKLDLTLD